MGEGFHLTHHRHRDQSSAGWLASDDTENGEECFDVPAYLAQDLVERWGLPLGDGYDFEAVYVLDRQQFGQLRAALKE